MQKLAEEAGACEADRKSLKGASWDLVLTLGKEGAKGVETEMLWSRD